MEGEKDRYGLEGWFLFHRATYGEIQGWFGPDRQSEMTPRKITEDLLEILPEKPGVRYYTGQESGMEEEDQSTFRLTLYGDDPDQLDRVAEGLEERLTSVEGVLGIKKAADRPTEEIGLVVDRDRAQRLGVNPQVVAGLVGYALRGQALPRYSYDGREIPVRVQYREEDRSSLRDLESFQIPTGAGGVVSLRSLTESRLLPASRQIWREDRRISRSISFQLEQGTEAETKEALQRTVARYDLPEGVRLDRPSARGANEELQSLLFALGLSVVFIYLLMAFLFESFVLPISIIIGSKITLPGGNAGTGACREAEAVAADRPGRAPPAYTRMNHSNLVLAYSRIISLTRVNVEDSGARCRGRQSGCVSRRPVGARPGAGSGRHGPAQRSFMRRR